MTKGGSSKPTTLGRLLFGEKRKQHVSPTRHRSVTRNGSSVADLSLPAEGVRNKSPINVHDWAVWRMQLNEQMGNGTTERADIKQMRQFLQSNPFYQQHSRDPSSGRYNGVRLLFSIPHAKVKSEQIDGSSRRAISKNNNNIEMGDMATYDQNIARPNSDDRTTTSVNSMSAGPSIIIDKTINQLLPRGLKANVGDFLHIDEQMVAADAAKTRRTAHSSFSASDRVHSTLQKAVKDGNVLEKIKAFEMQAAAAQAESATKLSSGAGASSGINNRMQSVTSSIQSVSHRTLSPVSVHPIQHPITPIPMQQQQQYIRSHRGRYVHPVQHRRDGNPGPIVGHESRKGAHVLEPAHGDIILKRRTPSQKTVNDEDYSMTAVSSMVHTAPQGQHRQPHYHHRTSASRSRHRQEIVHDKRTPNHTENVHNKHQQKQKVATPVISTMPTAKTSTRRRWLKGRKETPTETPTEGPKQDILPVKSNKTHKNKKEKVETTKKTKIPVPKGKNLKSSDNNRVYGVPNAAVDEQTKFVRISPQPPPIIEEENESDREREHISISRKEEDVTQSKECDTIVATTVERRSSRKKYHQKLSSTDGEILSKTEDDTRFSRPTDDHAHRSELKDEDEEYKSEGDVFIEEASVKSTTNINTYQPSNVVRRHSSQCSAEELPSDRRWQWSKESGGLIDKGSRKKKQLIPLITRKNKVNQEEEQVVYESPNSEQIQAPVTTHTLKKKRSFHNINPTGNGNTTNEPNNNKQISKQILHAIMNSTNNNQEQPTTDEFFENGPYTNPEETIANMTTSA